MEYRLVLVGPLTILLLCLGCTSDPRNDSLDAGNWNATTDGDSDADSDNDADSDADNDADADADSDADADADSDADSDADNDADSDADSDADTDADGDTCTATCLANCYNIGGTVVPGTCPQSGDECCEVGNPDGDADTDADSDADSDADTDADGDTDTEIVDEIPTLIGDIVFEPSSMTFEGSISVTMTTEEGLEIRYTTDGTVPTSASTLYSGAISVTATTQLRAQPFANSQPAGDMGTALYVVRTINMTSDLPIVLVDGYGLGKPEDKEVFKDAAFMLFDLEGDSASLSNTPTVATRAGWHLRGQSSASFDKAPYRIELWDNADEDSDYPILGMPSEADWALIGPFADRTLIRNAFVYTLGREMGMEAPRFAFADTYINYDGTALNDSHYQGVYMVVETIKNAKNRTDLKQLREGDTDPAKISGGYIMKFDQMAAEEPTIECSGDELYSSGFGFGDWSSFGDRWNPGGNTDTDTDTDTDTGSAEEGTCWSDLEIVDPVPLDPVQETWITDYIQQFHEALHAEPMGDVFSLIDIVSFVDQFLINEFTRDVDSYIRSSFYHKERDGLLKAGPLWDYNFSLYCFEGDTHPVEGWQWEDGRKGTNDWFIKLPENQTFMTYVSQRWQELRQTLLSDAAVDQRINDLKAPLVNGAARDYEVWPVGSYNFWGGMLSMPDEPTWDGQIEIMRDWMHQRIAWLDTQLL